MTTEKVPSKHEPLTDHALIRCAALRVSKNGIKKRLAKAVRYALMDVSWTYMARTSPVLGMNP